MRYRTLGRTGLEVSTIGLGGAALGGLYGEFDVADGVQTVRTALDLGINLIDNSPYYGLTSAETVLGRALQGVARDRYVLATKCGRYGLQSFDFSPRQIRSSLEKSLQRLGVDTIDLFQLHDIEFGSLDGIITESIPAMEALRDEGKIRFYGITGLPLSMFRYVLEHTTPDTILSYCHYALNDDTLSGLLPMLAERGVGVINGSPTGMGLLTVGGAPDWHPAGAHIKAGCQRAVTWCQERGVDITKLALQFATSNQNIASTLVGTASPLEITAGVAWVDEPMDSELVAAVREVLAPIRGQTWPQGRPENNR